MRFPSFSYTSTGFPRPFRVTRRCHTAFFRHGFFGFDYRTVLWLLRFPLHPRPRLMMRRIYAGTKWVDWPYF